jgi:NADPH:quinone reductase-like Zn-dependent oxidoreductase
MKAIAIEQYGGPEVLRLMDLPKPSVMEKDVLIEIHAASVNPVDWKVREGYLQDMLHHRFPLILGWDAAGIVAETGPGVTRFTRGDKVFTLTDIARNGTYAEYAAVDEQYVAMKPANISFEGAAAVPLVGLTAWQALVDYAGMKKGDKVLIHAGSGGVGSFAIQLAKSRGCFVATTCSTSHVDFVKALGADQVVDYTKGDFSLQLHDYDIVFDTIGGETYRNSFKVLRQQQGVIVSILEQPDHELAERNGVRAGYLFMHPDGHELEQIGELLETGRIKPVIGKILHMEEARHAQLLSQSHHARGKIVLQVKG